MEEGVGLFPSDIRLIILSPALGGISNFLCSQAHNKKVATSLLGTESTACFTFIASSGVILAPFLSIAWIAFLAIPYFSRAKATRLGLVATNHATSQTGHPSVLPVTIPPNCLAMLPVFIEEIAWTSSNAFNALTLSPIHGRSFSNLSSFISFPLPIIFATLDIAPSLRFHCLSRIVPFTLSINSLSGQYLRSKSLSHGSLSPR